MNYIVYDTNSGRILRSVTCPPDMIQLQYDASESAHIEHTMVDDTQYYVVAGQVVQRPEFTEQISGTVISNLPVPTTVVINEEEFLVDDGSAELSFEHPGSYTVRLVSFPYIDKTVEVTQL